jgi:hypothetical protein
MSIIKKSKDHKCLQGDMEQNKDLYVRQVTFNTF